MRTLFVLFIFTLLFSLPAVGDVRSQASYYISTYGLVDIARDRRAQRAMTIFRQIRRVAEDPINHSPSLKIIKSKGKPWVLALPDGVIILTSAALKICYRGVDPQVGDARLAFVLGHELAHLTANDFWHRNIYLSLSGRGDEKMLQEIKKVTRSAARARGENKDWRDVIKQKELQADDAGFLYASLAGYRTDLIFTKSRKNSDFLKSWVKQTQTLNDDIHYKPEERSAFLLNRFKQMTARVEFFMSGVRLAHFGRLEDSLHFFQTFQRSFPAHEVLNNLGYVNLQLARKHMPKALRNHYWVPSIIDNLPSLVIKHRTMGGSSLTVASRRYLEKAEKYLLKASKAHRSSVSSRLNLAIAYMYLGRFHSARAQIEDAIKIDPKNSRLKEMRAIILYEQEKDIDMWPVAVGILEKIRSPTAYYNLARLYEQRGRKRQAKLYWKKIVSNPARVPAEIYVTACRQLKNKSCRPPKRAKSAPMRTQLRTGVSIESVKAKNLLDKWQHRHEKIGPLPVDLYRSESGDQYLAVENEVALVVVKQHSYRSAKEFRAKFGYPRGLHRFGQLEIWSYGPKWAALVESGKVREVWIRD